MGSKSRSTWSGTISFGLVVFPVGLHTTTKDVGSVKFSLFDKGTLDGVKMPRVNARTGQPVQGTDRGVDVNGTVIKITDEEIEAVSPVQNKTIEITSFVPIEDIDPLFFKGSYYVAPGTGGGRAYAMLLKAMTDNGRVAIGKFVMRSSEYLVAIRPVEGALVLNLLHFGEEVKPITDVITIPDDVPSEKELKMAELLIDTMVKAWDPMEYQDEYKVRVRELVEAKAAGTAPVIAPMPEPAASGDLMDALEASLKAAS